MSNSKCVYSRARANTKKEEKRRSGKGATLVAVQEPVPLERCRQEVDGLDDPRHMGWQELATAATALHQGYDDVGTR